MGTGYFTNQLLIPPLTRMRSGFAEEEFSRNFIAGKTGYPKLLYRYVNQKYYFTGKEV